MRVILAAASVPDVIPELRARGGDNGRHIADFLEGLEPRSRTQLVLKSMDMVRRRDAGFNERHRAALDRSEDLFLATIQKLGARQRPNGTPLRFWWRDIGNVATYLRGPQTPEQSASKAEDRCTFHTANAILEHFGKPLATASDDLTTGIDLMHLLRERGLKFSHFDGWMDIKTLKDALTRLPKQGVFYLAGHGHAMAFVDGKLTDTNPTSTPGRRSISAMEVTERSAATSGTIQP